ncbi:MAG TPA: hypothetical protein VJ810_10645 [Blastocatellia bacterium]|nr:hypothetical protein [Blastocatellia bacterium]
MRPINPLDHLPLITVKAIHGQYRTAFLKQQAQRVRLINQPVKVFSDFFLLFKSEAGESLGYILNGSLSEFKPLRVNLDLTVYLEIQLLRVRNGLFQPRFPN